MLKMIICDDDKIFCSSFEDLVIEICRERNLKYEIFMFYETVKLKKFLEDNNDRACNSRSGCRADSASASLNMRLCGTVPHRAWQRTHVPELHAPYSVMLWRGYSSVRHKHSDGGGLRQLYRHAVHIRRNRKAVRNGVFSGIFHAHLRAPCAFRAEIRGEQEKNLGSDTGRGKINGYKTCKT